MKRRTLTVPIMFYLKKEKKKQKDAKHVWEDIDSYLKL